MPYLVAARSAPFRGASKNFLFSGSAMAAHGFFSFFYPSRVEGKCKDIFKMLSLAEGARGSYSKFKTLNVH